MVRRPWSGNAKAVMKGIGVVTCVDANPETDQFWLIDYRLYAPDGDGKSKLDPVRDRLTNVFHHKRLPFYATLADTGYATKELMLLVEVLGKVYDCPLKGSRQVDDSGSDQPDQRVDSLSWNPTELARGKTAKLKGFPKDHKVEMSLGTARSR